MDCGPHTVAALGIAGVALSEITDIIFTHLHDDHFHAQSVALIAAAKDVPLRVMVPSLETLGIITKDTHVVLSHLATCLHRSYAETCDLVKNDGLSSDLTG